MNILTYLTKFSLLSKMVSETGRLDWFLYNPCEHLWKYFID